MDAAAPLPPPPAIADDWGLFLDVDGTLLEFAARPEQVQVPGGLIGALEALHRRLDGALALVSGRPLKQLDALFAPLLLPAAGLHGLEPRGGGAPHVAPPQLHALRERGEAVVARFPGALVEDKDPAVAFHWRGNPDAAGPLRELAESALSMLPGYRLQPGDHVIELRPQGADKGEAIRAMLREPPFHGRRPVFVGDDRTDEHGFSVVQEHDGIAIVAGEREPTAAGYRLRDIRAVREWLQQGVRE